LIVLVLVVVLVGLLVHGVYAGARHSDAYLADTNATFAAQLNTVFDAQNQEGASLSELLGQMATLDRPSLALRLRQLVAQAEATTRSARLAATPAPSADAGARAVAIVSDRSGGIAAIAGAVEALLGLATPPIPGATVQPASTLAPTMISSTTAVDRLAAAGAAIVSADAKVGPLRADLAAAPGHARVVPSTFVADPGSLSRAAMVGLVASLQASSSLQAAHRVSLTTLGTVPGVLPAPGPGALDQLPPTKVLEVRATVSNLGNVDEGSVSVVASLVSPSGAVLAQARQAQPILQGSAAAYDFTGLAVTPGAPVLLRVAVVPPLGQSGGATLTQQVSLFIAPESPTTTLKP
jgi:hypothetical protein